MSEKNFMGWKLACSDGIVNSGVGIGYEGWEGEVKKIFKNSYEDAC
jgi:hypothetical protein